MAKKILIIEDDQFLGDVLIQKLNNEGFDVRLSTDGAQGLSEIKNFKPDLVLLDIVLPSMNGYEILENKVKDGEIAEIPVIIISNSGQPVEISRALSLGVSDYLVKADFDPEEVLVKVRQQLGGGSGVGSESTDSSTPEKLTGKHILWVEDDKFLSDIIIRKLSSVNCKVSHVTNGEEALNLLKSEKPDIIILDLLLPGMDGYEILQNIKKDESTKNIPVIVLSNLGQKSDMDKAKELGAERFLIKATITLDEIIAEISSLIASHRE